MMMMMMMITMVKNGELWLRCTLKCGISYQNQGGLEIPCGHNELVLHQLAVGEQLWWLVDGHLQDRLDQLGIRDFEYSDSFAHLVVSGEQQPSSIWKRPLRDMHHILVVAVLQREYKGCGVLRCHRLVVVGILWWMGCTNNNNNNNNNNERQCWESMSRLKGGLRT